MVIVAYSFTDMAIQSDLQKLPIIFMQDAHIHTKFKVWKGDREKFTLLVPISQNDTAAMLISSEENIRARKMTKASHCTETKRSIYQVAMTSYVYP